MNKKCVFLHKDRKERAKIQKKTNNKYVTIQK